MTLIYIGKVLNVRLIEIENTNKNGGSQSKVYTKVKTRDPNTHLIKEIDLAEDSYQELKKVTGKYICVNYQFIIYKQVATILVNPKNPFTIFESNPLVTVDNLEEEER
jgi:hypothetical protein